MRNASSSSAISNTSKSAFSTSTACCAENTCRGASFCRHSKAGSASATSCLIIVDLPPEEDAELCLPALAAGVNFIRLPTPTTDEQRAPKVLANTSVFL